MGGRFILRLFWLAGGGRRKLKGFLDPKVLKLFLKFELPLWKPCLSWVADCLKFVTNRRNLGLRSTGTTWAGLIGRFGMGWMGLFWNAGNLTGKAPVVCRDLSRGSLRGNFRTGPFLKGAFGLGRSIVCRGLALLGTGLNRGLRGWGSFLECLTKLWDLGDFCKCLGAVGGPATVGVFAGFVDFALTSASFFWSAWAIEASNKIVP